MRCRLTRSARLAYAAAAFAALLTLFPIATAPAVAQSTSGGKAALNTSGKNVIAVAAPAVVAAPASAAVSVLFAGNPLPVPSPAHAPYRDPADSLLCVAPESLAPLGITFIVDEKADRVSLMGPEGASVTVGIRRPAASDEEKNDRRRPQRSISPVFVPVAEVIEGLGGSCVYDASKTKLSIRAALSSVEMLGGQLRVKAAFPVTTKVFRLDGGRKVVIDIPGAEIGKLPASLPIVAPNLKLARCGQFQPDVARIVLELNAPGDFTPLEVKPSTQLVLNPVATPAPMPPASASVAATAPTKAPTATARKGGAPQPPTVLSGVTLRAIDDKKVQIVLAAGRVPEVRTNLSQGQLTLDLANTTLGAAATSALGPVQHPLLRAVQVLAPGAATARLVVDLSRMVTYTVRPNGTRGLIIELGLPRGAGGKLAGKLVIVDAGHGGTDSGARGVNGTYEKNNNLAIAQILADNLRDAGANVIMTRATDVFIPLGERSHIANRAGADFFLSVHCDSTGGRNRTINGSTVYYHLNVASCKALAQSIAERLAAEVGTIRSKGIRSDGVIYPGAGFSVLRRSQMVSVLVETGYMTNPNDARYLSDAATRKRIAGAIASGLRDYIEGNPYVDTRNINPQPESPWSTMPPAEETPGSEEGENAVPTNVSSIR